MPQRSRVLELPKEVKAWLDDALIDGNFSGYQSLEEVLREKGFAISRSALHRYGQEFERRLSALKIASEQARAIADAVPDDEGAMSDALIRLFQEKAFQVLLNMETDPKISFSGLGQAIAQVSGTSTTLKRWQAEVRVRAQAAVSNVEAIARQGGLSAEAAASIRQTILGIAS
ncbi:MAG: DUF3486 family protein [Magnetococcales bacterium]|nr:DUF3486 family protein [Magnetococcales bacterium]